MNTFTPNQTLTINDTTYEVILRKQNFLILSIISDDMLIRQFPIKSIGQHECITVNNLTLFANDFTGPTSSAPVTRDFTKEEAEKFKEYLSTLWTGWTT